MYRTIITRILYLALMSGLWSNDSARDVLWTLAGLVYSDEQIANILVDTQEVITGDDCFFVRDDSSIACEGDAGYLVP